ncbi:MAG: immune inhibitor A, partial [Chloroflexota bacterium]
TPVPTPAGSANDALIESTPTNPTPESASPPATEMAPPSPAGPVTGDPPTWPTPVGLEDPFLKKPVSSFQQEAFNNLAASQPPERDNLELARLYNGWDGQMEPTPVVVEPLEVGTIQQLNVLNHDLNTINPITAELLALGEHAYFWFDTGPGSIRPSTIALAYVTDTFDDIYRRSVAHFGPERNPGVDGDPRLHVVNASPSVLCDMSGEESRCGLAGYFSADDGVPSGIFPDSNAREMFVMNVGFFGTDFYLNVLTHELRHMIEDNYDQGDADWEAEGSAVLAEDLLGFPGNAVSRANVYLAEPDQQLNRWPDEYTLPAYGQGYLLNRYIYDRIGPELYREFAASPDSGLRALESIAQAHNLDITGESLWLDWLVAQAIHDLDQTPLKYQFGVSGLDQVAMRQIESYPASFEETVHQYAADYYHLTGDGPVNIDFDGSHLVPLLDTVAASGESMWLANRANFSHMTLDREVELTEVNSAALHYSVYHDIEAGYDFAYLFVSEDGGQSWGPLVAENMQGQIDDPSDSALTDRFYTGRSEYWREEKVDLTPYAGKNIVIRFAYITDLILTKGGIAIDNLAIPEIGFYDDGETALEGWTAAGFERVPSAIPQQWHLQLITFPDGIPTIESIELTAENKASLSLPLAGNNGEAILIVAASAPMTLEQAQYRLVVSGQ